MWQNVLYAFIFVLYAQFHLFILFSVSVSYCFKVATFLLLWSFFLFLYSLICYWLKLALLGYSRVTSINSNSFIQIINFVLTLVPELSTNGSSMHTKTRFTVWFVGNKHNGVLRSSSYSYLCHTNEYISCKVLVLASKGIFTFLHLFMNLLSSCVLRFAIIWRNSVYDDVIIINHWDWAYWWRHVNTCWCDGYFNHAICAFN